MTKAGIDDYLLNDLKALIKENVDPCLQIGVKTRSGFFSVPELVLTCVDYLGALYVGWNNEKAKNGRPIFTSSSKAEEYLRDVFGQVFSEYKIRGDLLWEIYRHGTVHLNEPKTLQNGAKRISWYLFKGGYGERMIIGQVPVGIGNYVQMPVSHLVPMQVTGLPGEWILPVCTTCLYEDLLSSIHVYAKMIQTNSSIEDRFRNTVNEMVKPDITNISWS